MPDSPTSYCYDGNSQTIDCPTVGVGIGQDCCFTEPQPQLEALPQADPLIVRDDVTHLEWQVDSDSTTGNQAYWECQNDPTDGGNNPELPEKNWRVPTVYELTTILDFGLENPHVPIVFTTGPTLWTATSDPLGGGNLTVGTTSSCTGADGTLTCAGELTVEVLCVRGPTIERTFLDGEGGLSVIDSRSLLQWTSDIQAMGNNWENALGVCNDLTLTGFDDWRLPSVKELMTLAGADMDFGGSKLLGLANYHWSSTPVPDDNSVFRVELPVGRFMEAYFGQSRVRCVRGPVTALPNP
jgi:hypothetical protein